MALCAHTHPIEFHLFLSRFSRNRISRCSFSIIFLVSSATDVSSSPRIIALMSERYRESLGKTSPNKLLLSNNNKEGRSTCMSHTVRPLHDKPSNHDPSTTPKFRSFTFPSPVNTFSTIVPGMKWKQVTKEES